jgi:hypothetical protein
MQPKICFLQKFALLFCLVFKLLSCTSEIENPPWDVEPVPVVFSVITPDQAVQVYVGISYSSNELPGIYTSPRVFIAEKDSAWKELQKSTTDSTVFIDLQRKQTILPGKTYMLRVEYMDKIITAQTTLPNESAVITNASCVIVSTEAGGSVNGTNFTSNLCALNVQVKLPANPAYGCYLTAFSNPVNALPFLSYNTYLDPAFQIDKAVSSFQLNIVTVDAALKKFRLAEFVSSNMFDSDDITELLATYGGVYPDYSNIQNGIGLFGSFVVSSKNVFVTSQTPH